MSEQQPIPDWDALGVRVEWDAERDMYRITSVLDDANPQLDIEVTGEEMGRHRELNLPAHIPLNYVFQDHDWGAIMTGGGAGGGSGQPPLCSGQEQAGRMAENRSMDDGEQTFCPLCRERPAEVTTKGNDSSVCYECLMDMPMELMPDDLARSMGHVPAEEAMDMGREPLPERPEVESQHGPYTHYRPHLSLASVSEPEAPTRAELDAGRALNEYLGILREWSQPIFIHMGDQHWA